MPNIQIYAESKTCVIFFCTRFLFNEIKSPYMNTIVISLEGCLQQYTNSPRVTHLPPIQSCNYCQFSACHIGPNQQAKLQKRRLIHKNNYKTVLIYMRIKQVSMYGKKLPGQSYILLDQLRFLLSAQDACSWKIDSQKFNNVLFEMPEMSWCIVDRSMWTISSRFNMLVHLTTI